MSVRKQRKKMNTTLLSSSDSVLMKIPCVYTVKPVLSGRSKIDKTKVLMANDSLMKVKVLQKAPFGAFCNILACMRDNWPWKPIFAFFLNVRFSQV